MGRSKVAAVADPRSGWGPVELEEDKLREKLLKSDEQDRVWMRRWETGARAKIARRERARAGRGVVTHSAERRLLRELAKVKSDASWGVSADIVDDNILYWHCNVAAPGGVTGKGVLHLELTFPPTYPAYPPSVRILGSDVDHPNIFPRGDGHYICVDMLQEGDIDREMLTPFTGWSSAYGVQSILRQLQSFFYTGADSVTYGLFGVYRPQLARNPKTTVSLANHVKCLATQDSILYTVENDLLRLFDISNPEQRPRPLTECKFKAGEVQGVFVNKHVVFVDLGRKIKMFDCKDAANPMEAGDIKIKVTKTTKFPQQNLMFYKHYLYAYGDKLRIYDISTLGNATLLAEHALSDPLRWGPNYSALSPGSTRISQAQGLMYSCQKMNYTENEVFMQSHFLRVFDLKRDPLEPVSLETYVHLSDTPFVFETVTSHGATKVYTVTRYGIEIFDTTNIRKEDGEPLTPELKIDDTTPRLTRFLNKMSIRGQWAYLCAYDGFVTTVPLAEPTKYVDPDYKWHRATMPRGQYMHCTGMAVDSTTGCAYVGFASPSERERIRIKQWSSESFWEVMTLERLVNQWRDYEWDPHSRCWHSDSGPGWCKALGCNGYGRYYPRWVALHQADCAKLECAYNAYVIGGKRDEAATVTIKRTAFTKKHLRTRKHLCTVHIISGDRLDLMKGYKHIEYRPDKTQKCRIVVLVRTLPAETDLTSNYKEWSSENTKAECVTIDEQQRETTLKWDEWLDVDLGEGNLRARKVIFNVCALVEDRQFVSIGEGSVHVNEITDEPSEVAIPLDKGGVLNVALCTPREELMPYIDVSFKEVPKNKNSFMTIQSCYDKRTWFLRRREGYECDICGHSPGLNTNPPLPSAIECDDAPPFALEAFHRELLEAAGDDEEALESVKRVMNSLEEEQKELTGKKHSKLLEAPRDIIMRIMEWLPRNRERRYMAQVNPQWEDLYLDARFWEAQHLKCYSTGAGPEEDVLGIGVLAARAANDRPVFSCQFDPISITAYNEGVRLGVWKEKFTHWLPLYIDRWHAQRSMKHLDDMVSEISKDIRTAVAKVDWSVSSAGLAETNSKLLRRLNIPGGNAFSSTGWVGIKGGEVHASGVHYFQVQVLEYAEIAGFKIAGKHAATGVVKIGWVTNDGDVNIGVDGLGYCYVTGGQKVHRAEREAYGPVIQSGDVVGTLWDANNRTISYYLNGEELGVAFVVPKYKKTNALAPAIAFNKATVSVDIEGGFDAPVQCESSTLFATALSSHVSGILIAVPQIMNNLVVEVMKGQLHASVKALAGYCAMHRLMLHCCDVYDELQEHVEKSIERFVEHNQERHKSITPDLGALLCLLSVSKRYSWEDVKNAFLTELFGRHVRWSVMKSKVFAARMVVKDVPGHDTDIMKQSFRANLTSCKLVMFQVFFLKLVKPPGTSSFGPVKDLYDSRMGFPTEDMTDALIEQIHNVDAALRQEWPGFLANISARELPFPEMAQRLRDAVKRSDAFGYHDDLPLPCEEEAREVLDDPLRNSRKGDTRRKGRGKGGGKGRGKGRKGRASEPDW